MSTVKNVRSSIQLILFIEDSRGGVIRTWRWLNKLHAISYMTNIWDPLLEYMLWNPNSIDQSVIVFILVEGNNIES